MSRRVEISTLLPPITLSIATISCIVFLLTISSSPSPCHAFAPTSSRLSRHYTLNEKIGCSLSLASSEAPNTPIKSDAQNSSKKNNQLLTHADIEWRLRPPEGTSRLDRLKIELGANIIRADRKLRGLPSPPLLCPKGGRALLEAYYKEPGEEKKKKVGRFGITTARGPSCDEIDTTIRQLYQIDPPPNTAAIAAIIYMFVEPDHRNQNIGALALDVISAIHTVQGVDFTVLVADDNGSGGLVRWYERNGYSKAPLMQDVLGSPGGEFGVAMIRPVRVEEGFFERCLIRWW